MTKATSSFSRDEEPEPSVTVVRSGDAQATNGETVVTGYRGPAPEAGDGTRGSVQVSNTGHGTASNGGTVITGYVDNLTVQQRPPQEPATWPHQVGVIPPAARSFQHRVEVHRLRSAVEGGGTTVLTQLLTGMGGVGKTQLAAHYARTSWDETSAGGGLDVLVWITASNRSSIVTAYAQAGVELCRGDPGNEEQAARSFLAWLTPKHGAKSCRWLIILDDVNDPNDLKGLWPPASPFGRTLVTTRRRDAALAAGGRRTIEIGLFTEEEALRYLTESLAGRDDSAIQLRALAHDLGYLPLALSQAAAYLIDTGETVADYRDLLADRATALAALAPDVLPDDQALPLAAAWSLSIDHADTLSPVGLARPMLQLASMLDANGIPESVLTSQPALVHLAAHRTPLDKGSASSPTTLSPRDGVHALRALHRLSLIEHSPRTPHQAVRVHQLIQRTTRDALTPDQYDWNARAAADALIAAWPEVERDTDLAQSLRANTTALSQLSEDALFQPGPHAVLYRMGESLGKNGQVAAARNHYQRLTEMITIRLGEDHLQLSAARSNLAFWQAEAGDVAGAAAVYASLLEDMMRVAGDDHPNTLTTRSNLAAMRGKAGDFAGAAEAYDSLLVHRIRLLGEDHPKTLITRLNLAAMRGKAGDFAGAAEAYDSLLADQIRVLGEDHPNTLTTRSNLAAMRGDAGDTAGAAEAMADLLKHMVRVLGKDHPDTLTARGNLAFCRGDAGDFSGAVEALEDLLKDRVRVLGEDHPDTLVTRNYLAAMHGRAGNAAGAVNAYLGLLADQIRVLGKDHPETLTTRNNLAYFRGQAGDRAGAAAAFAELLSDRVRVLGKDHLDVLATWNNLAFWQGQAGNAAGAASAYASLLEHTIRVTGQDAPQLRGIRQSLAYWRSKA
ncbi:FxSxx-COOH system tetratricopeptide repeat protein [Streptomyces griseorubiginosus]|uniref:FxSxx-COOH system tetratricopeptide repeat protein n=1 Tax=Streptomyces griseorubiginosus TaxID=67304 RepID=UPI0036EA6756